MSKMEDVLEAFVTEIAETAVEAGLENHDFSDEIEREVENILDHRDFSGVVESALDDYDFGEVIRRIKEDIQEEIVDETKDAIYEDLMSKIGDTVRGLVEKQLPLFQAGLVPVGNDNAEARPKVRVTLNLTFERDYIADCVKIGKANPTAEELQALVRHSLQPFLKQEGEVVTEPPVAATVAPTVTEPAKEVA